MFTISETCKFQVSEEKRCQTFSFIYLIICVDSQPGLVPISLSDKKKFNQKAFIGQLLITIVHHHLCVAESKKSVHLPKVFFEFSFNMLSVPSSNYNFYTSINVNTIQCT